jgi:hypothetical protein
MISYNHPVLLLVPESILPCLNYPKSSVYSQGLIYWKKPIPPPATLERNISRRHLAIQTGKGQKEKRGNAQGTGRNLKDNCKCKFKKINLMATR